MSGCAGPGVDLVNSSHGYIDEVGFSGSWSDPLRQRPPRNTGYSRDFCSDRFLHVQRGDSGSNLALIDIREQLVYDGRMHAEIDYTGFAVSITFHPAAFGIVEDILEVSKPTRPFESTTFLMRIPTAAFSFPAQRGGPDPGAPGGTHIKELRGIKQLMVQDMVVARTARRDGQFSDDASMLERYQMQRTSNLAIVHT